MTLVGHNGRKSIQNAVTFYPLDKMYSNLHGVLPQPQDTQAEKEFIFKTKKLQRFPPKIGKPLQRRNVKNSDFLEIMEVQNEVTTPLKVLHVFSTPIQGTFSDSRIVAGRPPNSYLSIGKGCIWPF